MHAWGRLGGLLLTAGLAVAASGCGQLFTGAASTPSLGTLASRVDSLDAQVGELQAALANSGQGGVGAAASGTGASNTSGGVVNNSLPVAVVEAGVLNVRADPSLTGTIKGTLLQNAKVNVLANQGNWAEIRFSNPEQKVDLVGWVDADYLGPAQVAATSGGSGTVPASSAVSATFSGSSSGTAY